MASTMPRMKRATFLPSATEIDSLILRWIKVEGVKVQAKIDVGIEQNPAYGG